MSIDPETLLAKQELVAVTGNRPTPSATCEHAILLQVTHLEKLPYNLQTQLRYYNNADAVCCDPVFTVLSPADQASIPAEQPSTDNFADTPGQLAAWYQTCSTALQHRLQACTYATSQLQHAS